MGLDFVTASASTFLFLIIETDAATISMAKTTITKSAWVTLNEPILKNTSGKNGIINLRAMNTVIIDEEPNSKTVLKLTKPLR